MTGFDPAEHRMVPAQRWFEDFSLGERFVLEKRKKGKQIFFVAPSDLSARLLKLEKETGL